jgi:pectate lyase
MQSNTLSTRSLAGATPFQALPLLLTILLLALAPGASAQRINLNFTAGADYVGSSETSPATPGGPAGTWNNISLTAANTNVTVVYADGSPGPTLTMDTGRSGNWTSTITTQTADYTGSGAVYDVANLYEAGLMNGNNATLGYRLRGLAPGTYAVHMVPMYRGYDAAGSTYLADVHLIIGMGNDTDAKDVGGYTLVTTNASPEQYMDTSLTSWVAATAAPTAYNYVTATVTVDSTNRWLTFLFEDGDEPDRPGPAVIQIELTDGPAATLVPVITESLLVSQGMILRGTNGPASGTYQVLASTNLTLPMSNWTNIAAHSFDVVGNFDSTNPVASGAAQQFFRLLVGGTLPPAPTSPSIQTQPQSQTAAQGDDATFTVIANGTSPLSYQWYFNTNTPLANATNSTFTLTNAQATNAGKYSVVVTNVINSVTSAFATLTVTAPSAPAITTQPAPQSVSVGQTAAFSVIATGTSPLAYQWFFNTNTTLSDGTNATLTISNAQTNNAGGYSVIVTNSLGAVTSVVATLTVNTNVTSIPSTNMIGYATLNGGTTGGQGGATVTVSNFTDFNTYVGNTTTPYIIQVVGTINLGGSNVRVRNNKTIVGLGTNATLVGDLKVDGNNNVIIRNLNFTNPDGAGDNDGLTLQDCLNVWVDHCTFYDGADGNLDITHGADWVTVSWCRFFYTNPGASHRFSNLVGHSDNNAGEDAGKLHVTFHHNWWGQNVHERMPRVRFGRIHSFNNYFNSPGNNYCFRVALGAEVRIESNYFLDVHNPWEVYVTTGTTGKVHAVNNILTGSTSFSVGDDDKSLIVPGTDTVFVPAYSYTLDTASMVPNTITNYAGAGKGPFAP